MKRGMDVLVGYKALLVLTILCVSEFAAAQPRETYSYDSEVLFGLNKNSIGGLLGGFLFRLAYRKSDKVFTTYGIEIVNVKSPQESRVSSSQRGESYLFGKSNYLYAFRFQYGRDIVLFEKNSERGAEIKAVFALGPSIGLITPYHILWSDSQGYLKNEQYDYTNPNHAASRISGRASQIGKIGDSKIAFGLNLKVGASFELGTSKHSLTGFEVGFLLDLYTKKIPIVPAGIQNAAFPSVYVNLIYGYRRDSNDVK